MLRSHTCGELKKGNVGQNVTLAGWVQSIRDHGGLTFIDLRDRYGFTQVVYSPEESGQELLGTIKSLRSEWVIQITGEVQKRPGDTVNDKIPTGEIEINLQEIKILNKCKNLPFEVSDIEETNENLRLTYRYIDLRRRRLQENLKKRSFLSHCIREFLITEDFIEVETPVLTKSTPEGARDFIVPSRLNPGKFYALPQSPQLFKQILMVAGIDKYFQIARCFRDEDLRADRQPEFTQIDIEMSFVEEEEVITITEKLLKYACEKVFKKNINVPFRRMSYKEAMSLYGTDKPDVRFELKLENYTEIFKNTSIRILKEVIDKGNEIKGIKVREGEKISVKDIETLNQLVKERGGGGIGWIRFKNGSYQSPLKKHLEEEIVEKLKNCVESEENTIILFLGGEENRTNNILGEIRNILGNKLYSLDPEKLCFLWIVDFPLFEFNREENRLETRHHPFTSPEEKDMHLLESEPLKVRSKAYDIVLNGTEIGGGSIRIHKRDVQEKMFKALGLSKETYLDRFNFLLEALDYGAPPHGGIAIGLDRLSMILLGEESIRDTIAFPKTQKGACLLTKAPGEIDRVLLKENKIKIDIPEVK